MHHYDELAQGSAESIKAPYYQGVPRSHILQRGGEALALCLRTAGDLLQNLRTSLGLQRGEWHRQTLIGCCDTRIANLHRSVLLVPAPCARGGDWHFDRGTPCGTRRPPVDRPFSTPAVGWAATPRVWQTPFSSLRSPCLNMSRPRHSWSRSPFCRVTASSL